jgi:hypothetical protein
MLSMQMLELRGGYLYQHRPDVVPHGFLSDEELALWAAYYEIRAERAKH